MRYCDLHEGVQDHFLYHATSAGAAREILKVDRIEARTNHTSKSLGKSDSTAKSDWVPGVSLTRSLHFASNFRRGEVVVFVLDRQKLQHRYQLRAIDYYMASYSKLKRGDSPDESEEFVVSSAGIRPLSRYLLQIRVPESMVDFLHHNVGSFSMLLDHPLLKIIEGR